MKYSGRLLGIGNAATDIVCLIDDETALDRYGLTKGQCVFLGDDKVSEIIRDIPKSDLEYVAGGSAANVVACFSSLGGSAEFIGKMANDECGGYFADAFDGLDVVFQTSKVADPAIASTQIFTFVTPDGERSFAAYYGASHAIEKNDVELASIMRASVVLLDGYMLMSNGGADVLSHSVDLAQKYGRSVVFMPADLSVIEARHDESQILLKRSNSVICNGEQALALTKTHSIDAALKIFAAQHEFGCVTDGENGVHAFMDGEIIHVENPYQPEKIVSTNGAGDNFSGGFLYGIANGFPLRMACRLGMYCALECLKHQSPRPQKDLSFILGKVA